MTHTIDINPLTNHAFRQGVEKMANIQFLLKKETETWLNSCTPGWSLWRSQKAWLGLSERSIWLTYFEVKTSQLYPMVTFEFQSADHALLFKLTWG